MLAQLLVRRGEGAEDFWKVRGRHWYREEERWYYRILTKDPVKGR